MKAAAIVLCVCLACVPAAVAKPKLSEVIQTGKSTVLVRTLHYSPPFFDFPTKPLGNYAIEKGGGPTGALIVKFKIPDPVIQISDALAKHLIDKYDMKVEGNGSVVAKSEDPAEIPAEVGIDSGFILDVVNISWITISDVTDPERYILGYKVRVNLIDASTKKVVRSGLFDWTGSKGGADGNPNAERSEHDASVFRAELEEAGTEAVKYFLKKTLSER